MDAPDIETADELDDTSLPPSPRFEAWTRRFTDLLGVTSDAPTDKEVK